MANIVGYSFSMNLPGGTNSVLAAIQSPLAIREKAAEIVSRPEYQLDQGLDKDSQSLWAAVLSWILKPFIWFFESIQGLPPVLKVIVVVLLVVVMVALIVHIVWSFVSAIRGSKVGEMSALAERERDVDPRRFEQLAESAAAEGHYVEAVRFLFKASLLRIEQSERKKLRVGITNRELLRRYQKSPLAGPLSLFTELIDRKWYGTEDCESTDFETSQFQHSSICQLLKGRDHAVGA